MLRLGRVSKLLVVAAMVVGMAGAGGAAASAGGVEHVLPYGENYGIRPVTDNTYCLESEGDGRLLISQCVNRDDQHFTFTHNTDNTIVIVDGFGLCLDRGNGKAGTALTSKPCTFGATQRFRYTATGKFQQPGGTSCMAAAQAAQNAAVFDTTCGGSSPDIKIFVLSH